VARGTRKSCKFGFAASPLLHSPNSPWHLANPSAPQRDHLRVLFASSVCRSTDPVPRPFFNHRPHVCNTRSQAGYWTLFDHHPRFGRRFGGCGNDASERSHTSPFTQTTSPSSHQPVYPTDPQLNILVRWEGGPNCSKAREESQASSTTGFAGFSTERLVRFVVAYSFLASPPFSPVWGWDWPDQGV
jgi:hypothetical protein